MVQLSMKLRSDGYGGVIFWCPGCERPHRVGVEAPAAVLWEYNGDPDRPTFKPSVKITYNGKDAGQVREDGRCAPPSICHLFVTDGQIQFLGDCTHALAGQTVELPDLPEHLRD